MTEKYSSSIYDEDFMNFKRRGIRWVYLSDVFEIKFVVVFN